MTTPFKVGTEFQINTTTLGDQDTPSITALADGRFVVAWTDASGAGLSLQDIKAQIFNADGSKSGAEFLVNTTTLASQIDSSIAELADGRFIVTWTDGSATGADASGLAIRAQIFNADRSHSGGEFLVNTTTFQNQGLSSVTALDDGRFVVAWYDESRAPGDTSFGAIRAQIFNPDGSHSGSEFVANTTTLEQQDTPKVTALDGGRFVITWQDFSDSIIDTSGGAIRSQMFDSDGSKLGAEIVENNTGTNDQIEPAIATLANGAVVYAWADFSGSADDPSVSAIRAIIRNGDGSVTAPEFLVNTFISGAQDHPSVAALANGGFVIAYESADVIDAQAFYNDGTKEGVEFRVNLSGTFLQFVPSVTALADGRFVVSWTDSTSVLLPDLSGHSVRGQIFDPREAAISLNGTLADDQYVGTLFADHLSGSFGNDSLTGAQGDDELHGGLGNDTLTGGRGNDVTIGEDGNDKLSGNFGSDQLYGGAGNDVLNGGVGADVMVGGTGNDVYTVDLVTDLVIEAADEGIDHVQSATISLDLANFANVENAALIGGMGLNLTGTATVNALTGNSGANTILGLGGNDRLSGLAGADHLDGGAGNDTLNGGAGTDQLTGGADTDVFMFTNALEAGTGALRDVITDFVHLTDKLDVSAFMHGGHFIGNLTFSPGQGRRSTTPVACCQRTSTATAPPTSN